MANGASRAIADFTCYARVSSVLDGGSPADIRRVNSLLKRDKFQSRIKVDAVKLAEEEAQAKKEKTASWGARLANHPLYVLFALFGTIITVTTGWPLFIEQLYAWGGKTSPSSSQAPVATMPVITGWYTFCQPDDSGASSNMLNLLYDIEQYAGKVVFFDVQVRVDCVMGGAYDPTAPLSRMVEDHSLTYSFGHQATGRARASVDGGRDSARLYRFLPENGSLVHVLGDPDGRNALTNLGINIEGADDELYGPYLIKARQDDAVLTLELSAPTLDSAMQASASAVAQQRRIAHENDPPPIGLPKPIPLNADDLRRYKELSASSATPTVHGVPLPNTLPPGDAMAFDKHPLPPLPPPRPAALKR